MLHPDWLRDIGAVEPDANEPNPEEPTLEEHPERLEIFPPRPEMPAEMERQHGTPVPLPLQGIMGEPSNPPARSPQPPAVAGPAPTTGAPGGNTILQLVMPGGNLIGIRQKGSGEDTRTVPKQDLRRIIATLMANNPVPVSLPTYPGQWYRLPDGSEFGVRAE